jgi:hypothetical protein
MPAYNPNIPQPNDLLSDSQGDILQNFGAANTSFAINHYEFDDATAKNGKHKFVSFPPQGASPVTVVGELALFSKTLASGVALFLTRDNNTVFDVQLTTSSIVAPASIINGYTFLPGGLLMQWGTSAVISGTSTINFNVPFSAPAFNVQITGISAATSQDVIYLVSTTSNNFTYRNTSSTLVQVNWCSIGPKP